MTKSYGITYIPTQGTFAGVRIPVMRHYGFAILFSKQDSAQKYANKIFGDSIGSLSVKVQGGIYCVKLVCVIVEVYSGRLEIVNQEVCIKDPYRPSYKKLLASLMKSRKRQMRDTDRQKEIVVKVKQEKRRLLHGTGLVFSQE